MLRLSGAEVSRSASCEVQFLDDGCHAAANCPAAHGAVLKKHTFINRVVAQAGRDAGLTVRAEPDTHSLLLGELSKSDCRRIFPKQYASKDYRDKFDAFIAATELVASPTCVLSVEAKRTCSPR